MKQKEVPEMDDVEEIISKISEDSPYKRRPTQKRTWMTVPEMGKLLGLKKTDRYWLVHKNIFESRQHLMQKFCKNLHRIAHLFHCIGLRSGFDQKCLWLEMHIITVRT